MTCNQSERELRRIWGNDFDKRMEDVVDVLDTLAPDAQQRILNGGPADLQALAAMKDPAYINPKHPDHAAVSQMVNEQFNSMFGSDPAAF